MVNFLHSFVVISIEYSVLQVSGHGDYLKELDTIMKIVGVRTKQDIVIKPLTSGSMMARSDSVLSFTSSEGEEDGSEKESVEESHGRSHDQTRNLKNLDSMSTGQQTQNALNQLHLNDVPDEKGDIPSEELINKSGNQLSANMEFCGVDDESPNNLTEVEGKLGDSNIGSEHTTQQLDDRNMGSECSTQKLDNPDLSPSNVVTQDSYEKINSHQHNGTNVESNSSQFENNNIHDAKLS